MSFDPAGLVLLGLVRTWPGAVLIGLSYWAFRGPRRDRMLHALLPAAVGFALAAVLFCCAGWPFGGSEGVIGCVLTAAGVLGGVWWGLATFTPGDPCALAPASS